MGAKKFAIVVVLTALLAGIAAWAQDGGEVSPADELYRIQLELEQVITGLALSESLEGTEVDQLRRELARLYHDLEQLANALGETPPQAATPPPNPAEWQAYSAASKQVFPAEVEFSGWSQDSNLGVEMGGYGQILLRIENSYYLAEWNIQGGYSGQGTASVSANVEGDVLLRVEDSQGSREFKLEDGGLGTAFMRILEDGEPEAVAETQLPVVESTTEGDAVEDGQSNAEADPVADAVLDTVAEINGEWYTPYLDLVREGHLESSDAMAWFITQAQVHTYETDALRDLGEALNRMGGGAGTQSAIGEFVYYLAGERQTIEIPDPRTDPLGFSHLVSKAYILNLEGKLFSVEMK